MMKGTSIWIVFLIVVLLPVSAHGEGYRTVVGEGDDAIPLVVVKGTPYEMGYAFGSLMKEETRKVLKGFLAMARASGGDRFTDENLDAAWKAVGAHTSDRFKEELRGIAAGSGLSVEEVVRAHMIPVVEDYACSGVALWGKASLNGDLFQIRNLDYSTDAGLQDYPAVVIYIPEKGIPHVNVTFAGCAGVNTGMNAEHIALTEIGDTPRSDYPFDLDGAHFTTMFRDILYTASSLDEALDLIKRTKRIKKYHYVVGDGEAKKAVKIKAHAPDLEIWTDQDSHDELAPKTLDDVVYHCESRNPLAWDHLNRNYGKYDAEKMIDLSRTVPIKGGNLLDVVYNASTLELWVAYAEKDENAYLRPYVHIDMKDYLPYNPDPSKAVKVVDAESIR